MQNAPELKVDPKKGLLVGGDSAGGNLAAVVALAARDDPFFATTPVTGQYLREPATCHAEAYPEKYKAELRSFGESKDTLILTCDHMINYYSTSCHLCSGCSARMGRSRIVVVHRAVCSTAD